MENTTPPEENLDDWDPMANDYFAPSNIYNLNPDDAEVILTGYSA